MKSDSKILWQINPWFVQNGKVSSQCFEPTSAYEKVLSVYDGEEIDPEFAWLHHTQRLGLESAGVVGVRVNDCRELDLRVHSDPIENFEQHATVDFSGKSKAEARRCAKKLKVLASQRGLLFRPEEFL